LLYHRTPPPGRPKTLPRTRKQRQQAFESLALEHGFSQSSAAGLSTDIDFLMADWGAASSQQRAARVFAGMASHDQSPEGKMLMPLLIELAEAESRMRVRQRLEFIISELSEIGLQDPRKI